MISASPVVLVWLAINAVTLVLALAALRSALRDRAEAESANGSRWGLARRLAARGDVRRERFRVVIQLALMSVAIPPLLAGRDVQWSWGVVMLMVVPVLLFLKSAMDAQERRRVVQLLEAEVRGE